MPAFDPAYKAFMLVVTSKCMRLGIVLSYHVAASLAEPVSAQLRLRALEACALQEARLKCFYEENSIIVRGYGLSAH